MPAKDKHSSLIQAFVNYRCENFNNIGPLLPGLSGVSVCVAIISLLIAMAI
jgi:hypothetical protein